MGRKASSQLYRIWVPNTLPPTSKFERVKQWLVFGRQWHLLDANNQCIDKLAHKIKSVLSGAHKPIYHEESDCGDHVIVYNCRNVAMKAFDWKRREYYFNNTFPKGRAWYSAHEIHKHQPTRVLFMTVYSAIGTDFSRRRLMERLHLFPDEHVPQELMENVSNQLEQVLPIPKSYDDYTAKEKADFPALFDWPQDFVKENIDD